MIKDCYRVGSAVDPSFREQHTPRIRTISQVSVLSAGRDKPYALGLASALISEGVFLDFVGSDEVDDPELHRTPQVNFLNLRRDQRTDATLLRKVSRVLAYYLRLLRYAVTARPMIFHILWNNKFELLDRTLLMLYYKSLGKKIVFTVHNVNAGKRDNNDSLLNQLSLKIQYGLCDHLFVHTDRMKRELASEFAVPASKVSVIPFGINNTVPNTALSTAEAKRQLGLNPGDKTLLFFGNIAPYKGLDCLVAAFAEVASACHDYRLLIAGRPKQCEDYWNRIQQTISRSVIADRVIQRIEYVPDAETELYFKAADALVLPYIHIFQSGVLFLGYGFGLPVIAADVGSMKEEIVEGKTGFVFNPQDVSGLAQVIRRYFASELFGNLEKRRQEIKQYANERYSWKKVAEMTTAVYSKLNQV